jgi:hypothetical protein
MHLWQLGVVVSVLVAVRGYGVGACVDCDIMTLMHVQGPGGASAKRYSVLAVADIIAGGYDCYDGHTSDNDGHGGDTPTQSPSKDGGYKRVFRAIYAFYFRRLDLAFVRFQVL